MQKTMTALIIMDGFGINPAHGTRKEPEHTQKIGRLTSEEAGQA